MLLPAVPAQDADGGGLIRHFEIGEDQPPCQGSSRERKGVRKIFDGPQRAHPRPSQEILPDTFSDSNPHGNLFSPRRGLHIPAQGRAERRQPRSAALGHHDHQNEALKGRYNDLHERISETRPSGSVAPIRVVCASTGRALPHGRASDFRFVRISVACSVSPFQGSVRRRACLLDRHRAGQSACLGTNFCRPCRATP